MVWYLFIIIVSKTYFNVVVESLVWKVIVEFFKLFPSSVLHLVDFLVIFGQFSHGNDLPNFCLNEDNDSLSFVRLNLLTFKQ